MWQDKCSNNSHFDGYSNTRPRYYRDLMKSIGTFENLMKSIGTFESLKNYINLLRIHEIYTPCCGFTKSIDPRGDSRNLEIFLKFDKSYKPP